MISANSNLDTISCVLEVEEEKTPTIFKVPRPLHEVNERAYEPNGISIGPYHYGKPHLARMEYFKKWLFKKFVEKPHLGLDQFQEAMKHLKGKIRKCYERPLPPDLEDDANFVHMMVYDGCFVVQLILEGPNQDCFSELGHHVFDDMWCDLLLLENQLPFFVLLKLYSMIKPDPGPEGHFIVLARYALELFVKDPYFLPQNTSIRHLLDLVHTTFKPSVNQEKELHSSQSSMPSATELEDAGIHLLAVPIPEMQNLQEQWKECMFGITFDNVTKELKIPTLQVHDFTERLLRNYMAYEQYFPWEVPTYFVYYVVFLRHLINTSKDVELLRKSGIIDNLPEDDEAVTKMFKKLLDSIYYNETDFHYKDIVIQVIRHCKMKRNIWKWKAKLKKDYAKLKEVYFNTAWSPISFIAALVLLLLTILQTIFSLLSYYHQRQ